MSPLRDLFIAPAPGAEYPSLEAGRPRRSRPWRSGRALVHSGAPARSVGILAPARELPAIACATGLVLARGAPAALVCLRLPSEGIVPAAVRAPSRGAAARMRASLAARDVSADARGRLVIATLPTDPLEAIHAAQRALAAAGSLPTVVAAAVRDEATDDLLAAQGAIVVAIPASAGAHLADLALAGAEALAPSAATFRLSLDPLQRVLALGGLHAPCPLRAVVEGVLA